MTKFFYVLLLLAFFQSGFAIRHDDAEKITHIINEYVEAWNHRAGKGFTKHFSLKSSKKIGKPTFLEPVNEKEVQNQGFQFQK